MGHLFDQRLRLACNYTFSSDSTIVGKPPNMDVFVAQGHQKDGPGVTLASVSAGRGNMLSKHGSTVPY